MPLFSLENHRAAADFDVLAFNLSAELVYTNVLNCSTWPACRSAPPTAGADHPLVVAGGHCAFNPEPLADFVDAFVLGDGEEVVGEITEVVAAVGQPGSGRRRPGRTAPGPRSVPGVYVPCVLRGPRTAPGRSLELAVDPPVPRAPERVEKRTIADLADWPYPKHQLVPLTEVVHDRLNVEIFRGCTRGCRFCQAGMITRPVRERPAEQVRQMVRDGLARTGYDEVASPRCRAPTSPASRRRCAAIIDDPAVFRAGVGQPAEPPGRRLHASGPRPRSRGSAGPGSPSRPRAGRGGCARSSTS